MARTHYLVGGAAAFIAAASIAACTDSKQINMTAPVDPLLGSYVSLGNSITAGYQGGGINTKTQQQSYAVLFAKQAATRFAIPALTMPGCPPPIDTFPSHRYTPPGYPASTSTSCYARKTDSITSVINNVAVPGAATVDPTSLSSANSNALSMFILGGLTQDQRALQANPTFASIWIGNNDVLAAALSGILVPAPPYSPGVTPLATFRTNYANMMKGLLTSPTLKGGVLFAVIDVTNAPLLFHSNLLSDPAILAAFSAAAGQVTPLPVDPSCANSVPLISFQMAGYIAAGTLPALVTCKKGVYPAPVGDLFVLDSVEVPAVVAAVAAYNLYIKAKADSLGWAYVDMNPTLAALKAAGAIPAFPNLASPTNTFGNYFTLDGVHPSALAHTAIADLMIDSVNAHYGTSLQPVP